MKFIDYVISNICGVDCLCNLCRITKEATQEFKNQDHRPTFNLRNAKSIAKSLNLPEPFESEKPDKKLKVLFNENEIHFGNYHIEDYTVFFKDINAEQRRSKYIQSTINYFGDKVHDPGCSVFWTLRILYLFK